MILSESIQKYFCDIVSKVAAGLAEQSTKTPYWIENNEILNHYECIRAVWIGHTTISNACRQFNVTRSSYYQLEDKFIKHGVLGLFPFSNGAKQHRGLEKLVLLVKKCHPGSSQTEILRVAQALPLTKDVAQQKLISSILYSHGYGHASMKTDPDFWGTIQRRIKEVDRALKTMLPGRDKKHRKETFFIDNDHYHKRLECLRELFFNPKAKIKSTCIQYNLALMSYYRVVQDYRLLGVWAIVSASSYGKKESIANELQLKIILEKLKNPSWSAQEMVDQFKLKCSRFIVSRILKSWQLTGKGHRAVSLQRFLLPKDAQLSEQSLPKRSAFHLIPEKTLFDSHRKNRHFELICKKMKTHTFNICDPGALLLAPFLSQLGVVQALEMYGPKKQRGKELTSPAILNIMRIIAGYRRISHLGDFKDRSVAFASGIGIFGSRSKFYEDTLAFKFEQLYKLRSDLVLRGKELDVIQGIKIAFDFHFKKFFGDSAEGKGIGKGPDKSGKIVPGFRPHVAWDLATNSLINIAYYEGGVRGPAIMREFCEQNIFPMLDPLAIEEIYMDSEYTKESDIHYLKEMKCTNGDVYICLKQNKQIKKLIQPALDETKGWEIHDADDEKKAMTVVLPKTGLPMVLVILRKKIVIKGDSENVRCFGCTDISLSMDEVLTKYRYRWVIENGLKDLVYSYFIDEMYGCDPEKIEFEFYCVMVARLAYEFFLKSLGGEFYNKQDGNKVTLQTMRNILFEKRNCTLHQDPEGNLILTFLDLGNENIENALIEMYSSLMKSGDNKVLWWNNRGLLIQCKNQYG